MMSRWITITGLLALTILCNTGLAAEEYVLTLDGQEVRFTAVPEEGRVVKDELGRMKAERRSLVQDTQLLSMPSASSKISYHAPLFSVNGQTVGVTPEVVVRVTGETSREALESLCGTMGLQLLRPMPFTTREYVLEALGSDAGAVFAAVRTLNEKEFIEWAWPNLILYRDPEPVEVFGGSLSASTAEPTTDVTDSDTFMEPNDPFFPDQWHLHNTGQTGGTPGADINALAAWEITTGDPNIVVAVIDTGVDMNHPDLVAALVPGYDFWDDDDWPQPLPTPGDAHGTMCAGMIGAQGDNGIGVVGVAWNCKIMPIRIDAWGDTPSDEAAIATALRWAAVNGADIISNSWGFLVPLPIIHSAIKDISQSEGEMGRDGKGCTVVSAGGNEGIGSFYWPASYPEVITVGGTNVWDERVSYSNYGPELDIVAPSGSEPFSEEAIPRLIWTTDISGPLGWNAYPGGGSYFPYPFGHIYDYGINFGTSFAVPQVAGVAALILSIEPDLTNEEVRYFLTRSAKDLGDPGKDDYYGWGRLDARAALDMVLAERADLNNDGTVNEQDLARFNEYIETNNLLGDIAPPKRDGVVDFRDWMAFAEYIPDMRSPRADAADVPRDVILRWIGSPLAERYDVYFGTSREDVADANRATPLGVLVSEGQDANTYGPEGLLAFDETYYWRIDEVGAAPESAIFEGVTWSFTTEPYAYVLEHVTATTNGTSQPDQDPQNTVNGSGLNTEGGHSTDTSAMWLAAQSGAEPLYIQHEFDHVYRLHEMQVWNHNGQYELNVGFGFKDVTVECSLDGTDWMALGEVQFAQATGMRDYAANTVIDFTGVAAQFVRLTVNSGYGTYGQYGLSEVRFSYIPTRSSHPQPADGATDVDPDGVLTWRAGREAVSHEVYLSTDKQAVLDGTALIDTVATSSYQPGVLDPGQVYYWKITEVNETETPGRWEGDVWQFTTNE